MLRIYHSLIMPLSLNSGSLNPPQCPHNFDQLDPVEQGKVESLYLKNALVTLYRKSTLAKNEALFKAMEFRQSPRFEMMLLAQNLLVDGKALITVGLRSSKRFSTAAFAAVAFVVTGKSARSTLCSPALWLSHYPRSY